MSLLDKEAVRRVQDSLKKYDQSLDVITLENSARTAVEAASSLGCEVGAIVKSLLFKTDDTFILTLIAGDKRCSLNKLKKITGKKIVTMASPESVKAQTGYTIGGVSPVGHLNKVEILIDKSLEKFSNLYAAAGHPKCIFKVDFINLKKITNGQIKDLIE
ncbi:YbaK/EbsC family protein [Pelagibacteraceae bacterium]|jgi:Cys-tRNA(Pro) deacylase|nr:YbaK/EbsC family protein [Pelagibacteraceae bacterium]